MTTAEIVNRIIEKFGRDVRFVRITDQCEFQLSSHFYRCRFDFAANRIQAGELENGYHYQVGQVTTYSEWIEGVLNGKT